MRLDPLHRDPDALALVRRLREAGHEAYFCGGCVRDALLGTTALDIDITTGALPEEVEALFERTVPVGRAFGVMVVVTEAGSYEVATFRTERDYADGRHPSTVTFSSAAEDVARRDFTVNALLYDPVEEEVIDHVGGLADLEARRIRAVGNARERFLEDHLRLLRAVRFAARTGFELEAETQEAVTAMAALAALVSPERQGEELRRMLTEGGAARVLELLEATHLLLHVLPEVARERAVPQPEAFHPEGDVLTHTRIMLALMEKGDGPWTPPDAFAREVLGWAVLLHDAGKPPTLSVRDRIRFDEHDTRGAEIAADVLERLRRPRRVIDAVTEIIGRHMHFSSLPEMRVAKRRRFLQDPLFPLHLELHRLDCASSHRQLEIYDYALAAWREERARPPEQEPLLTGADLIAMGYAPGPRMGEILAAVADRQLEGDLNDGHSAREWVRATWGPDSP
jgi:poly(A) polymerase